MDRQAYFWKNFQLGDELQIAGGFIYNGLQKFHELENLDYPEDLFEFLYDLSVGLERLFKIAIVLFEHSETVDQDMLERSLITHNHLELLARLRTHSKMRLGVVHNDLLSLLGNFYKSLRYDRFVLNSAYDRKREVEAFQEFLTKHLEVTFSDQGMFAHENTDQFRCFLRRAVLKIAGQVYEIIGSRARELNLYTYELRHGSKAESVFLGRVDFAEYDILWKELIIFMMNVSADTGYLRLLRGTAPLEFDPACLCDYLKCFKSNAAKRLVVGELEEHYCDMEREERNSRLQLMSWISEDLYFGDEEEEFEEIPITQP